MILWFIVWFYNLEYNSGVHIKILKITIDNTNNVNDKLFDV